MVSISSQNSLPFLQPHHLSANPALGLSTRIPGNEGFHLIRPKGELFLSQTRFPIVLESSTALLGAGPHLCRLSLYSTVGIQAAILPSVFSEFRFLAGLRSLVTSNLQLAEDQT